MKRMMGRSSDSVMAATRERMDKMVKRLVNHASDTSPWRYARMVLRVARLTWERKAAKQAPCHKAVPG
eukprot:1094778-Rhodomonas_salina.1